MPLAEEACPVCRRCVCARGWTDQVKMPSLLACAPSLVLLRGIAGGRVFGSFLPSDQIQPKLAWGYFGLKGPAVELLPEP